MGSSTLNMRKNKEKKTVRMRIQSLKSRLWQDAMRSRASCGLTLIEVLVVVVIIAIAAAIAIPMLGSSASMQLRSAANMIAADLEYAKSMAITKGQNFSVVFDTAAESYRIQDQTGTTIAHPVKKGFDYIVNFAGTQLDKVDITNVDFDPSSSNTVTFDYLGSPYSATGTSNPLNSGQINIQADNVTAAISVEPVTGYISVSNW